MNPGAGPGFAAVYSARKSSLPLLLEDGVGYRRVNDQWQRLRMATEVPDDALLSGLTAVGETIYALGRRMNDAGTWRLYRSRDAGARWTELTGENRSEDTPILIADEDNPCRVLTVSGRTRSIDCGETWETISAPGVLEVLFFDRGRWVGRSRSGSPARDMVVASSDAGRSWSVLAPWPLTADRVYAGSTVETELFAATSTGVYQFAGGSAGWTLVMPWSRLGVQTVNSAQILYSQNTNHLYLSGFADHATGGGSVPFVVHSTDGFKSENWVIEPGADRTELFTVAAAPNGGLYVSRRPKPDAFVAKYDSTGRQLFFTYLGGLEGESAQAVCTDGAGSIYVAGRSTSKGFPETHSLAPGAPGFVLRMRPDGTAIDWSTRLPVEGGEPSVRLACGTTGTVYVASSGDRTFALSKTGHYMAELGASGRLSASVADLEAIPWFRSMQLDRDGSVLFGHQGGISRWSSATRRLTRIAEIPNIEIRGLAIDPAGTITAMGNNYRMLTAVQFTALTTPGAFQRVGDLQPVVYPWVFPDGYVGRFSAGGERLSATVYGGTGEERILDGVVDAAGNLVAVGDGGSSRAPLRSIHGMPVTRAPNAFLFKLDDRNASVRYGTILSGFMPVRVLAHPDGGHWVVGSGVFNAPEGTGNKDAIAYRVRSFPVDLPRIDSIRSKDTNSNLFPRGVAVIEGEGFNGNSVVLVDEVEVAPQSGGDGRVEILLPSRIGPGLHEVRVRSGPRVSLGVRIRVW